MKVILTSDVKNLGKLGDVVNVKSGYARNYLIPRKIVQIATERRVKELNHLLNTLKAKKAKIFASKKELLEKVCSTKLTLKGRTADEGDKLFGSVTNLDISKALSKEGFDIDKRDIILEKGIKTVGEHSVKISLEKDLTGSLTVLIEKEEETKET